MKLYNLSPIGIGTEHVESFYSYTKRLAQVHGVSLGRLLREIKADNEKSGSLVDCKTTTSYLPWSQASMVRPIATTQDIVGLFTHYTGRDDLRCTTFLALSQLKHRSQTFFANSIRWCPCCLESDMENGRPPYLRLLWFFEEVTYCHHHNVALQAVCPHCEVAQARLGSRNIDQSRCWKCKGCLCENKEPMESAALFRDVCFRDLISLVVAIASDPKLEYNPFSHKSLLIQILGVISEVSSEEDFWMQVSKDDSLYPVIKSGTIGLKNLRRIAYRLGISLSGLLAGEAESWTAQLAPQWLAELPSNLQPPKRRKLVDRDEVLMRLTAVLGTIDTNAPPSLATVARIVGISTGGLEYLHPLACQNIKQNYQAWLKAERERKYSEATFEVLKYLRSDQPRKSRKHALKTIRETVQLPKNVLMEVIAAEFNKSNFSVSG